MYDPCWHIYLFHMRQARMGDLSANIIKATRYEMLATRGY